MSARRPIDPVAVGLVVGFVADRVVGDPRRFHPVAGFGQVAARVERAVHAPSRAGGAAAVAGLVSAAVGIGLLERRCPTPARVLLVAAGTWAVLGGRSLEREGSAVSTLLTEGDLPRARRRIRNLVGRDPTRLGADGIARACVESIAENSADAVVAPLLWGAVAGLPGLLGHRAVNTLDAMWGHRNERYREFGWAAARLDDVANWVPARLTVALNAGLVGARSVGRGAPAPGATPLGPVRARHRPVAAGRRASAAIGDVVRVVRRDAPAHPSPNAGPVEASWAAALGVSLGGTNAYDGVEEDRGRLGDGPPVGVHDIARATGHLRRLSVAALGAVVLARAVARPLAGAVARPLAGRVTGAVAVSGR